MIVVNLDVMMARRKISLTELAEKVDITTANLSILKTGKAKAIRFSTLESICHALECQPADILEYVEDKPNKMIETMKKILSLAVLIMVSIAAQAQQIDLMQAVPNDSLVRTGTLDSGIKYYIRANKKDPKRANFHIVYNVGAIQEADNQNGLAHFLEHMAFNGSKNFHGNAMIDYLQSIGVRFGENLNAGTGQEMTTYMITNVPIIREGIIDSTLLILHDWAGFLDLNEKDIDDERGVIREEWRGGNSADRRIVEKQFPTLFNNSIYSKRNVIGNEEVIKNFAYDDLRSFYKKWYRPDMQAFVIVGDFSADTMEMKLKATMADIKAATVKTPKDEVVIADNDEPLINISSDPELSATTTQIIFRHKPLEAKYKNCMLAQKQDVVTALINMMLGQRLDEISKQENAPFLGAGASYFNFIAPFDAFFVGANNKDGEALRGLEAIYTELVRMQRGGFVSSELERAKLNIITGAESAYKNRNDKRNGQFIQEYMDNFTDNTPYPSEQTRLEITKNMVENTTLAEVNAMAAKLVSDRNCAILLSSPKKDGITEPTQGEVMDVIAKVKNSKIDIYVDQVNNEPLISDSLKGSKITATDKGQFGSTVWTLANGVRVVLKKTELQADQVIMNSQQWGGTSLITDQSELFSIDTYSSFENYAGLSKFTSTELGKILTGKIAGVSPYFGTTTQGFSGSCAPKDIQTMLELTYLYMVHPRFDAKDLEIVKNNMRTMIPNLKKDPDYLFSEKLQDILYKDSKRTMKLEIAELDKITIKAMQKAYTMLLSNANGMVFTFVGNFDEQALRPLVEKYLGSLPSSKKISKMGTNFELPISGTKSEECKVKQENPKVTANVVYSGKIDYTQAETVALAAIKYILDIRYTKSVREEQGGTYGVGISISPIRTPYGRYMCKIGFDTDSSKIDVLLPIIYKEINDLSTEGPSLENTNKAKEFFAKKYAENLQSNGTWMGYLNQWEMYKEDYCTNYLKIVEALTPEMVKNVAKKAFSQGNMVTLVQRPE